MTLSMARIKYFPILTVAHIYTSGIAPMSDIRKLCSPYPALHACYTLFQSLLGGRVRDFECPFW